MNNNAEYNPEISQKDLDLQKRSKEIIDKSIKYIAYIIVICCVVGLILSWWLNITVMILYIIGVIPATIFIFGGMGLVILDKFSCIEVLEDSIIKWNISIIFKTIIYCISAFGALTLGAIIIMWFFNIFIQITDLMDFRPVYKILRWDYQLVFAPLILFLIIYFRSNKGTRNLL